MVKKRVLVTGGVGFIGHHLVKRLVSEGKRVEVVDDLSSSTMTKTILDFYHRHHVVFNEMSVEDWKPCSYSKYEQIYHLACRVGPARVTQYAGRMGSEIVGDAMKMADLAIHNSAPLISISTSEVYGRDPEGKPQHEELPLEFQSTPSARQEYTLGKYMTEVSLRMLAEVNSQLRVNLIRPFNIVGSGQTSEGGYVLPRFIKQALRGEPITVFGDGSQIRAFTHVLDLVESLIQIMDSGVNSKIYNVGTPENTCTIGDLAKLVVKTLDSKSEIHFVDPQQEFGKLYTNAPSKIPSIFLIAREIGWNPKWSLSEIILDTANSVKSAIVYETAEAVA